MSAAGERGSVESPRCEHHWASVHQPDFPDSIYWVPICSLCGAINGAELRDQVWQATASLRSRAGLVKPSQNLADVWDAAYVRQSCPDCRVHGAHLIDEATVDALNDAFDRLRCVLDLIAGGE